MLRCVCWLVALGTIGTEDRGELDVTVIRSGQELTINNPWPEAVPTIYVIGLPDRQRKPVAKTKGVTLAGVRLTETCLSESVLILYPGGTGKWSYHLGNDIFRLPDKVDPRTLVEYDKWRYDPITSAGIVGGDMVLLRLYHRQRSWPAVYELVFPAGVKMKRLVFTTNCSGFVKGSRIDVELFADRALKQLVAGKTIVNEKRVWTPVILDGLEHGRLFLRLSAKGPPISDINLYWSRLEADLDCSGLQLPTLKPGTNVWRYTDDDDSSHRARIVLRWPRKPLATAIWEDFEGKRCPFGGKEIQLVGPRGGQSAAFTGKQFARIAFTVDGKDRGFYRNFAKPLDLTKYKQLSVALRTGMHRGRGPLVMGLRNGKGSYQYVRLQPGRYWRMQTCDISGFKRDQVTSMNIHVYQGIGYFEKGQAYNLDLDTICFSKTEADATPPETKPELPAHVLNYKSPWDGKTVPKRTVPKIQEWFPLGVYSGFVDRRAWPFWLDDLKRHHMNAIYVSNGATTKLEDVLPLAEARGIRLIYQGTSASNLYYLHFSDPEARKNAFQTQIVPAASKLLPKLRDCWGVAAWSLTEEIPPTISQELADYYKLVRELAPAQPPTVLHNNLQAAQVDLETNRPLVITHDSYPFFWAPMHGPSNPRRSLAHYRSRVSDYYRLCRKYGASLWMMPQAYGYRPEPTLDPPHYNYRTGARAPEPGEIKLQGWVAIAEGATGLMYYLYLANQPGVQALRSSEWQPSDRLKAVGELFERVARVAPLLCRLERDYKEEGFVEINTTTALAHTFVKRNGFPGGARYVVVASTDGFKSQTVKVDLNTMNKVYDLVEGRPYLSGAVTLELAPGEGTLLAVGTDRDIQADVGMIERELAK